MLIVSLSLTNIAGFGSELINHTEIRSLELELQRRKPDDGSLVLTKEKFVPSNVGIVVVDMWNFHWCKTAATRVAAMVPRMNHSLDVARQLGIQIFLCPTDVADSYVGMPQREIAVAAPRHPLPEPIEIPSPQTRGGDCMCGPGIVCQGNHGWDAMPSELNICDNDLIAKGTEELYSLCKERGITDLLYMGLHTNMCLLGKPVGMMPMMRTGINCFLARDLNDACTEYDPARGYTPDDGTAEVIEQIEQNLAPTIDLVDEFKQAGLWQEDWIVDAVHITPWGRPSFPHQFEDSVTVTLSTPRLEDAQIRYTLDGREPTENSLIYTEPFLLKKTATVRAIAFEGNQKVSLESIGDFVRLPAIPPMPDIFISNLKPIRAIAARYQFQPKMNRSYGDTDLKIRGVKYEKGVGVYAPSQLLYELKPKYDRFVALAAIDETLLEDNHGRGAARYPSVIFRVFIDGKLMTESPLMKILQEAWRFDVKIPAESRNISLAVINAGDSNRYDLANWLNAGFMLRK